MKREITIGDKYSPAMEIEDQAAADKFFEQLVQHSMSFGKTRPEAEVIERCNLGYWAGYYDNTTRKRVERLFKCQHPIFGSIEAVGPVTPHEAFMAGVQAASVARQE